MQPSHASEEDVRCTCICLLRLIFVFLSLFMLPTRHAQTTKKAYVHVPPPLIFFHKEAIEEERG